MKDIVKPLNRKVIVEAEKKQKISKGGILIPESVDKKAPTKGTVIAIAQDSDINLRLAPGDVILFSKFAGIEITLLASGPDEEDRHLLIMKDEDILAVIEKGEGG